MAQQYKLISGEEQLSQAGSNSAVFSMLACLGQEGVQAPSLLPEGKLRFSKTAAEILVELCGNLGSAYSALATSKHVQRTGKHRNKNEGSLLGS